MVIVSPKLGYNFEVFLNVSLSLSVSQIYKWKNTCLSTSAYFYVRCVCVISYHLRNIIQCRNNKCACARLMCMYDLDEYRKRVRRQFH